MSLVGDYTVLIRRINVIKISAAIYSADEKHKFYD